MTQPAIRLRGVAKSYRSVIALHPTDLDIQGGEFFTLLGPSGSGKTTLLNLIAGTTAPSAGTVHIGGVDVTRKPPSVRDLGMVFQNYSLMPHMSVFENVAFPLKVRRLGRAEIARKVREALEIVRLPHLSDRRPRELSGGQQQRIALARSLVYQPRIVLMDEPLSALDKKLRDQMQIEIKQIHADLGVTIVYVTHDQGEALAMSDRICLMNAGRIEQLGPPRELYFAPASLFAADFLGESNILDARVEARDGPGGRIALPAAGASVTVPICPLGVGESAKVMIRPESLSSHPGDAGRGGTIAGGLTDTIMVGGVTEIRLALADGSVVAARELTARHRPALAPGAPVSLHFRPEDIVFLS